MVMQFFELTLKNVCGDWKHLSRTLTPPVFVFLSLWQVYDYLKRVKVYLAHSFRGLVRVSLFRCCGLEMRLDTWQGVCKWNKAAPLMANRKQTAMTGRGHCNTVPKDTPPVTYFLQFAPPPAFLQAMKLCNHYSPLIRPESQDQLLSQSPASGKTSGREGVCVCVCDSP